MLPTQYAWLANEPGPRILVEMLKMYGTRETPGAGNNPVIMKWAEEVGLRNVYTADSIPWCGLGMAVAAKRAGKEIPNSPLWALSWAKFGTKVPRPMLGDVLTFKRNGGGHVTLYIGEDSNAYHCLGCNQSDQVNITRIAKNRLYAARRSPMTIQPANIRVVYLQGNGALSINEA
jgi:uncharacterized protein (TIGR02594 family)